MLSRDSVKALSDFIRVAARAERADIVVERALPGDAGRAHYLIAADITGGSFAGRHGLVLRGQVEDRGATGLTSAEEFAIRRVALGSGADHAGAAVAGAERRRAGKSLHGAASRGRRGRCGDLAARSVGGGGRPPRLSPGPGTGAAASHPDRRRRRRSWRSCRGQGPIGRSSAPPVGARRWMASPRRSHASNGRSTGSPITRRRSRVSRSAIAICASAMSSPRASGWSASSIWSKLAGAIRWKTWAGSPHAAHATACRSARLAASAVVRRCMTDTRMSPGTKSTIVASGSGKSRRRSGKGSRRCSAPRGRRAMRKQGLDAMLTGLQSIQAEYDLLLEIEQFTAEGA